MPGETLVWNSNGDNLSWADPANWQSKVIPAVGDSVFIQTPDQQAIVYDNSLGTSVIQCLNSNRALSVTGGTLEIIRTGEVMSSITVTNGALKVTGRLRAEVK